MEYPHMVLLLLMIAIIIIWICNGDYYDEKFSGALQSLYSNDGIQDIHLTVNDDRRGYYDPYVYWRNFPWNLPTRNLNRFVFYPYLYEYHLDRYGSLYPYW